jgi:hypothetical protein
MFRKTTMAAAVVLGFVIPLANTTKAQAQQVISVRDPQTGQRYEADFSMHPRLTQECQSITAELSRLEQRVNTLNVKSDALAIFFRALPKLKADLARLQSRLKSTPKTVLKSDPSVPLSGSGNPFYSAPNPEWTKLQRDYITKFGEFKRFENAVLDFQDKINLEKNRVTDDRAALIGRLNQWRAEVVALTQIKGQP